MAMARGAMVVVVQKIQDKNKIEDPTNKQKKNREKFKNAQTYIHTYSKTLNSLAHIPSSPSFLPSLLLHLLFKQ